MTTDLQEIQDFIDFFNFNLNTDSKKFDSIRQTEYYHGLLLENFIKYFSKSKYINDNILNGYTKFMVYLKDGISYKESIDQEIINCYEGLKEESFISDGSNIMLAMEYILQKKS